MKFDFYLALSISIIIMVLLYYIFSAEKTDRVNKEKPEKKKSKD